MADKLSAAMDGQTVLVRQLDEERCARRLAVADGERQRRMAHAMDQLVSALLGSAGVDAGLSNLLDMFIDIVPSEVAVLRVLEVDRLHSRAAVGVGEEEAGEV